eukprot:4663490-Prorocentrum_lima.AAC.1
MQPAWGGKQRQEKGWWANGGTKQERNPWGTRAGGQGGTKQEEERNPRVSQYKEQRSTETHGVRR